MLFSNVFFSSNFPKAHIKKIWKQAISLLKKEKKKKKKTHELNKEKLFDYLCGSNIQILCSACNLKKGNKLEKTLQPKEFLRQKK
jgi:hypothetical protein